MFDFRRNRFDVNGDIDHLTRSMAPLRRGLFHRPLFSRFWNICEDNCSSVHLQNSFGGNRLRVPPESVAASGLFHSASTTGTWLRIVCQQQQASCSRSGAQHARCAELRNAQRFLGPLASDVLLRAALRRATRALRAGEESNLSVALVPTRTLAA